MKKLLYFAIAIVALTKLIDFVFYGRRLNDLFGALGFVLLLTGGLMSGGQLVNTVHADAGKKIATLLGTSGIVIVAAHFIVKLSGFGA